MPGTYSVPGTHVMTPKSAIIELQQEQALQDCECQSNGGYQGHQTAFWRLQGLSRLNNLF